MRGWLIHTLEDNVVGYVAELQPDKFVILWPEGFGVYITKELAIAALREPFKLCDEVATIPPHLIAQNSLRAYSLTGELRLQINMPPPFTAGSEAVAAPTPTTVKFPHDPGPIIKRPPQS